MYLYLCPCKPLWQGPDKNACWQLLVPYARITAERSIPVFWAIPIYIYIFTYLFIYIHINALLLLPFRKRRLCLVKGAFWCFPAFSNPHRQFWFAYFLKELFMSPAGVIARNSGVIGSNSAVIESGYSLCILLLQHTSVDPSFFEFSGVLQNYGVFTKKVLPPEILFAKRVSIYIYTHTYIYILNHVNITKH